MEFKAPLDTLCKYLTIGVILLFAIIGYGSFKALFDSQADTRSILIHAALLVFLLAIILVSYLFAPQAYTIDKTYLTVVRPAGDKKIKLAGISGIRIVTALEMAGAIRIFGVGGLFGYYGRYYVPKIGSMTFYATQRDNQVFIQTKQGRKILLTPQNMSLVQCLKESGSIAL